MNLTAEKLQENFDLLINVIETEFSGERKDKLLELYSDWGVRIATAPASTKTSYYNSFPGGYVLHVLDVCKTAWLLYDGVWSKVHSNLDFRWEELAFVALNHDLGKIGTDSEDYYVECKEDWMIKKGVNYVLNPKLQYMKVSDRSLLTLSSRGIKMTDKEYLGIKLYDGLYDDSNKTYFMSYNEENNLKTMLPYVIHQADLISMQSANAKPAVVEKPKSQIKTIYKFFE